MPLLDLHHVALKSSDLEKTVAYYTEVLGMELVDRPEFSFPGAWLQMGSTMFHIYGGDPAKTADGDYNFSQRISPVDHIALRATGFDEMRASLKASGSPWFQFDIPDFKLWQLFTYDPSGVTIELNFETAKEPAGSEGPTDENVYVPGSFAP